MAGKYYNIFHLINVTNPEDPYSINSIRVADDELLALAVSPDNRLAIAGFNYYIKLIGISEDFTKLEILGTIEHKTKHKGYNF